MTEGLLCFLKKSIDIGLVAKSRRDTELAALIDTMLIAVEENTVVLGEKMANAQYSFGTWDSLLYTEWEEFSKNPQLEGIRFTTYERLVDCFNINPCPKEMRLQAYRAMTCRKGYIGLAKFGIPAVLQPYIYSYHSYNNWQADWYRQHTNEITWSPKSPFLPNLDYVEKILEEELVKAGKYHYQTNASTRVHALAIDFHDKVMRYKGDAIKSFTIEVGSKICLGNAYTEECHLSAAESKAWGGAYRRIFSIDKNGHKQYISLDTAHGMFEFHDEKGKHLGEFHFDGSPNKGADLTHDFKTIS